MKFNAKPGSHAHRLSPTDYLEFVRKFSPSADPTSVFIFGSLLRVSRQLMQAVEKHLSGAGLSWAKFRLLLDLQRHEFLGETQGLQPSELSDLQGLSRNTVSALIAGLEEEGLISRALHPTDRRKFVIRLTPRGRRVLKSKLDKEFKFLSECFAGFTPAERKTLVNLLTRLNAIVAEN